MPQPPRHLVATPAGPEGPRHKSYMAIVHLFAAAHFSRECQRLELSAKELEPEQVLAYAWLASGAILSAVASLEACANEIFDHAIDNNPDVCRHLTPNTVLLLSESWEVLERAPTLKKFEAALRFAGAMPFARGEDPYQSAALLIQLRNALVHYKAEWSSERGDHARLEAGLKGRFPASPFVQAPYTFIPDGCLGHGAANWAFDTTLRFNSEFARRMSLPTYYHLYPQRLTGRIVVP
jgi:hypothetical protein